MAKRTRAEPTSEVGSHPQATDDMQLMWRDFFIQQNNNMNEIIKAIQLPDSEKRGVTLPKFNPDRADADAVAWCNTADMILANKTLEGSTLVMVLSNALMGDASPWLTQVCFPEMTWPQFKSLFLQRFGDHETSAAAVLNLLNSRPRSGETIAAFGNRLVTSLEAKWKSKSTNEVAVCVALATLARLDGRFKRLACTSEITTRAGLQHELMAFSYTEERNAMIEQPNAKKFKSLLKCHHCGKLGYKLAECHARKDDEKKRVVAAPSTMLPKRTTTCYNCGDVGHISTNCPKRGNSSVTEKQVNICEVANPKGILLHKGECFEYVFDSGAECSLVKESTAAKLSGDKFYNIVNLKGIGNASISSLLQILSVVVINDHALEILIHVVSNEFLKYDVMVGREILSMGFDVLTSLNGFSINRAKVIESCEKQTPSVNIDNVKTELTGSDKIKLLSILRNFSDSFIRGIPRQRVTSGQLEIRLIDENKTVQRRPYRMAPQEREIVREKIKSLLDAKVIRPSSSPFASPIILVKKKDGTDRLCVDYRELNVNTVSDKFPLPLIADQIARLSGAKYFSILDMASGFHQIPIHPDSIEKTAFVTPDGQYEYLTSPFGLKNAPAVFQRAILKALGDLAYSFVVVYMDDTLVFASTIEEGLNRLEIVLSTLTKAGFSFNIAKCEFLQTTVEYLGYEIHEGEIKPNSKKIEALSALPPPKTVTQLRQFIGLASYFRQFVPKFSQVMKPLFLLTSSKVLIWTQEHEDIRSHVISVLTTHPVLVMFNPQYPIELHTDACIDGYGAILLHKIDNKAHPVEYYSKTTTAAESKYHSYELETLAVVNSIKHFRHYLQGQHFTVFTDCNSLKSSSTKKELTPRVYRWWAYLQSFDFDIQYREGKRMAHADFLSRNPLREDEACCKKIEQKHVNLTEISDDWLSAEQKRDPEISEIVRKLVNNEMAENVASTYELRKGILYRKIQRYGKTKCLAVVPRAFRWAVINHVHEAIMHLGWVKTLEKIYNYYWFEKMSKYVRKFVDNCMTCRLAKSSSGKVPVELHPIPKVEEPWHTVHIDLTGKLSGKNDVKEYIVVLIDAFTKFVFLHHTLNVDAESCIKALKSSISLFGVPSRVIADQGRCFTAKNFRDFCSSQNIDLHLIATGASRANGQVERVMSTLKNLLTAVETSQRSWQDALPEIQLALNSTANQVTKCSPLELLIGKDARPFGLLAKENDENVIDRADLRAKAVERMYKAAEYDKERFDRNKAKVVRYKVGDFVLLKCEERHQSKLDPKFKGPFRVVEVLDGDRYKLNSLKDKREYKYAHEYLRRLPETVPDDLVDCDNAEEDNSYETIENVEIDIGCETVVDSSESNK